MTTLFEAAGGWSGMQALAQAWHARVMVDEVVGHAFSHGFHPHHVDRLAAYWTQALGGPPTWTEHYGTETDVVRMHAGQGEHQEMDERVVACFDGALADVGLDSDERLRQALHDYFAWMTHHYFAAYPRSADEVPDRLPLVHWSESGRVNLGAALGEDPGRAG